jgi:hypothetical protein
MDSYNAKNSSTGSLNGCEAVRIMEHYLKEPKRVVDIFLISHFVEIFQPVS